MFPILLMSWLMIRMQMLMALWVLTLSISIQARLKMAYHCCLDVKFFRLIPRTLNLPMLMRTVLQASRCKKSNYCFIREFSMYWLSLKQNLMINFLMLCLQLMDIDLFVMTETYTVVESWSTGGLILFFNLSSQFPRYTVLRHVWLNL